MSFDGTDFRIYEPTQFSRRWYSKKVHGPGLWYEVGVCISTGQIVWTHGPFPWASFSDVRILVSRMKKMLLTDEYVVGDGGYSDNRCKRPTEEEDVHFYSVVRARHETVNRRLKQFYCLGNRFRHNISLHSSCLHAVSNLTELMI